MKSEPYHLARRAICGVVSVLAAEELKNDRWKNIISHMSDVRYYQFLYHRQLVVSDDPHDREMGYLLLFSLHEVISSYISLSDLINVLNNGLNDPDFSVLLCFCSFNHRRFYRWPSKRAAISSLPRSMTM